MVSNYSQRRMSLVFPIFLLPENFGFKESIFLSYQVKFFVFFKVGELCFSRNHIFQAKKNKSSFSDFPESENLWKFNGFLKNWITASLKNFYFPCKKLVSFLRLFRNRKIWKISFFMELYFPSKKGSLVFPTFSEPKNFISIAFAELVEAEKFSFFKESHLTSKDVSSYSDFFGARKFYFSKN